MRLNQVISMAGSYTLIQRFAAYAASQGVTNPQVWAQGHVWNLVSTDPMLAQNWEYAEVNLTINQNPDLGARTDVITDAMIKDQVDALLAEQNPQP